MDKRGQAYMIDMVLFALMVALACSLLIKASPAEPSAVNDRYAANLAQSILLAFQHTTAGELGGVRYTPNVIDIQVPWSSGEQDLHHKTLAQLLVEDVFCNLRVEVGGQDFTPLKPNQAFDEKIRIFIKTTLDELIGGRFDYRLTARTIPIDFSPIARIHFETLIQSFNDNRQRQVCSETIRMCLPIPRRELLSRIQNICPADASKPEPNAIVEITLSLWSR
jgi:hypothetical protein